MDGKEEVLIDASDSIAGRLASCVAKDLLKGRKVSVVNAEKAVISGEPRYIIKEYTEKRERGDPYAGPFYPREPDRMLKRIVRGMLPAKTKRGKDALKRCRVYISCPEELKGREFRAVRVAENRLRFKSVSLGQLAQKLGAKKTW